MQPGGPHAMYRVHGRRRERHRVRRALAGLLRAAARGRVKAAGAWPRGREYPVGI